MVEQFRAKIDIDGDASGALSSIAAVEAALKKLDQSGSIGDSKATRAMVSAASKDLSNLRKEYDKVREASKTATNATEWRNVARGIKAAQFEVDKFTDKLNRNLNNKDITREGIRQIEKMWKSTNRMDGQLTKMADSGAKATRALTRGSDKAVDSIERANEALVRQQKLLKDRSGLKGQQQAYDKLLRSQNEAYDTARKAQSLAKGVYTRNGGDAGPADMNDAKAMARWERAAQRYADATAAATAAQAAAHKTNLANEAAAAKESERIAREAEKARLKAEAAAAKESARVAREKELLRGKIEDESLRNTKRVEAERTRVALEQARIRGDLIDAELKNQRKAESDHNRAIIDDEKSTQKLRNSIREREYSSVASGSPGGSADAARLRLSDAQADFRATEAALADATARYASSGSTADLRAMTSARAAHAAAATAEASALRTASAALDENSGKYRYAMYDAGQYQMTRGAAEMAPAVLGALAYGTYESSFSDVQRTGEIDMGGTLADGRTALNLMDGVNTASDRAYTSLMKIGTTMPVAMSDVFDTAAKAGSIGLSGTQQVTSFTKAISAFNAVADVASAEKSAEAFGRIGNLLGSSNYTGLASAVVQTGKAAAATDDQILDTTEELSMVMAATNATESEVIGLAGAFASLAVPPERARSVMNDFVTTMSAGMASTTPEIKALSETLGMSVDSVRNLWETDPTGLFMELGSALSGLDGTALVGTLDSIGLDGQRAMPTFQAIAKNLRESAEGADVFTTSLDAAAEGFNNPNLLSDAMGNKADDLAGKFQMLVNKAIQLASTFGSAMAPVAGVLMETIGLALSGLNSLLSNPVGQWAATIAGSIGLLTGAFRALSGSMMFLRGGRMAMDSLSTIAGGRVGRAGSLPNLLLGRDTWRRDGASGGTLGSVSQRATQMAPVYAGGSGLVQSTKAKPVTLDTTKAQRGINNLGYTAAATGGRLGRLGTGFKNFGGQLNDFVGGKVGWAVLGAVAAAAGIGAVVEATSNNQAAARENSTNQAASLMSTDETTGLVDLSLKGSDFANYLSNNIGGGITWWDKMSGSVNPFESTNDYLSGVQPGLLNNFSGFIDDRETRSKLGWWQQDRYSSDFGNGFGNEDITKAEQSLSEFGNTIAALPVEQQIAAIAELAGAYNVSEKDMGKFVDLLGAEAFESLVPNLNSAMDLSLGGDFTNGQDRDAVGAALSEAINNSQQTGSLNSGATYEWLQGAGMQGIVAQQKSVLSGTQSLWGAQIGYQEALATSDEWLASYGGTLAGVGAELDFTNDRHVEAANIMGQMASATFDQVTALSESKASISEMAKAYEDGRTAVVDFLKGAGITDQGVIDSYLDKLGLLPEQITTELITELGGDYTPEELLDVLDTLPAGKTVKIDALTDEARNTLIDLGFKVVELPDGSFEITAMDNGVKARLDEFASYDGTSITFNVTVLSETAQTELAAVAAKLDGLSEGKSVNVGVISEEAQAALSAIGIQVETLPDGTVTVTVPEGTTQAELDAIIAGLQGQGPIEVPVKLTPESVPTPQEMFPEFFGHGDGTSKPGDPLPSNPSVPLQDTPPSGYQPMPEGPYGTTDENSGAGTTFGGKNGPRLVLGVQADTSGATTQIGTWADGITNTIRPRPGMDADPTQATGVAQAWSNFTSGLHPISKQGADSTQATGIAQAWNNFTAGLHPVSKQGANSSQADSVSTGWFNRTQSLNPRPTLTAIAATAAAEAQLNSAARNRTSTITVTVRQLFATAWGGGGGMGRSGLGGRSGGGYTGSGPRLQEAGVVHSGEYVLKKSEVDQRTGYPRADVLGRMYREATGNAANYTGGPAAVGSIGSGVMELGPHSLHAIASAVKTQLSLDGKLVAASSSRQNQRSTRIGAS